MSNFQREGALSNAHVGRDFEDIALNYFIKQGCEVRKDYPVMLGFSETKKSHRFDLGGFDKEGNEFVVECKSHKWTSGANVPSAKMTVWNEVMLYFSLVPMGKIKVLFVLKDYSKKRNETLAEYYIRTYKHLIPKGVVIIEYDSDALEAKAVYER